MSKRRRLQLVSCLGAVVLLVSGRTVEAQGPPPLFVEASRAAGRPAAIDRTVMRSRNVDVQVAQLSSPAARAAEAQLELNLFSDATYTATLVRIDPTARGFVWVGRVADVPLSTVTIAVEETTVYGSIHMPSATYLVRPAGNGVSTIVEIDPTQFRPETEPLEPPARGAAGPPPAPGPPAPDILPAADDASTIDVLVLYTPAALTAAGGAAGISTLIANAISVTNTAYGNSGVAQRLRIAATAQVAYSETGNNSTDLSNVTNGVGALSGVAALRDGYRADLVTLLTHSPGSPFCGVAWLMTSINGSFAPSGYSVVEQACAVGNLTFPHELGHNMGLRHDWYVDAGITPATYAHGYVNSAARWRTIMAYNDRCAAQGFSCTRLPYWSNPGVMYAGAAMGVAGGTSTACVAGSLAGACDADDHRLLNESALTVANFRQYAALNLPLTIDFGALGLWNYGAAGAAGIWRQLHGLTPTVVARADIDGSGIGDVIVVFPGNGIWAFMNATTWTPLHQRDASDITAGDVDGNGRADLVINFPGLGVWVRLDGGSWSQIHSRDAAGIAVGNVDAATGQGDVIVNFPGYGVWVYLNRASWRQLHPLQSPTLRVGDLDGNGISDIVMQFAGYGEYVYYNDTTWTVLHPAAAAGIVVGDVDNDAAHRSDLIVNFPGAGVWLFRNGATWVQLHPLNATVMATVDVDGNGQDDVALAFPGYGIYLWKNGSTWTGLHPLVPESMAGR